MGSGPHLERRWLQRGKKAAHARRTQPISGVIFETLGHRFPYFFLKLFWKRSFSPLGRPWGATGYQKGSKMNPKWSPKRPWGYPVGSVRTMAGVMFSTHKGVSGRVREATFSTLGLQTHSGGVLGSIFADFKRFWVPFGVHFGFLLDIKRRLFCRSDF